MYIYHSIWDSPDFPKLRKQYKELNELDHPISYLAYHKNSIFPSAQNYR